MARALPSPAAAATAWKTNLGAAQTRYTDGVKAVREAPNAAAAAAVDRYLANVQANAQKFVTRNQGVSLQAWQNAAVNKGAQRLATGAAAAETKVQAVFANLFPIIEQVRGTLPARGDTEQNIARAAAFMRGMHQAAQTAGGL